MVFCKCDNSGNSSDFSPGFFVGSISLVALLAYDCLIFLLVHFFHLVTAKFGGPVLELDYPILICCGIPEDGTSSWDIVFHASRIIEYLNKTIFFCRELSFSHAKVIRMQPFLLSVSSLLFDIVKVAWPLVYRRIVDSWYLIPILPMLLEPLVVCERHPLFAWRLMSHVTWTIDFGEFLMKLTADSGWPPAMCYLSDLMLDTMFVNPYTGMSMI